MSKLTSKPALGGFSRKWDGVNITELTDYELVSISVASQNHDAFETLFKSYLKTDLPKPNQALPAKGGAVMWSGQDQYFLMLDSLDVEADLKLSKVFGETAYTVLQSDGWAALKLEGPRMMDVFERFIPLDLRNTPKNFATRTSAHHIAVIVIKSLDGSFLLLTPRSSAQSFLDALTHTINNVIS